MRVRDLLQNKATTLITVKPHDSLDTAVHLLIANNIGGLPVVDGDGGVAGFLAERDIVRVVHGRREPMSSLRVQDVMRAAPTCDIEDTVVDTMRHMTAHRHRHLVVCDGARLVGVLSVGDLVKYRLEQLETETGVLRDYVAARRAAR
jgi:CBS domain-containing protein